MIMIDPFTSQNQYANALQNQMAQQLNWPYHNYEQENKRKQEEQKQQKLKLLLTEDEI